MIKPEHLNNSSSLRYAFYSYVTLGFADIIHHLHAALALGQTKAIHAAIIGFILVPVSIYSFIKYSGDRRKTLYFWLFIVISISAITVPGIYHGGWVHFAKVFAYLRVDSPHTEIGTLFPAKGYHSWFYEITGILEFSMAVICLYFVVRVFSQGVSGK